MNHIRMWIFCVNACVGLWEIVARINMKLIFKALSLVERTTER